MEKSTIFAAYASHGVVPVLAEGMIEKRTRGVEEGKHFLAAGAVAGNEAVIAREVHDWYQGHRCAELTRVMNDLLE